MNDMKRIRKKEKSEGKNKSHDGLSQPIYKTVCSTSSIIHIIKTEPPLRAVQLISQSHDGLSQPI